MLKFNLVENALDSLEHAITVLTAKKKLDTGDSRYHCAYSQEET